MIVEPICSATNPKIKEALALGSKSNVRRERGLFLVEGRRELERCLQSGFTPRCLFRCPDLLPDSDFAQIQSLCKESPSCRCFNIPPALYSKIAYRGGTEGIVAEIESKERSLSELDARLKSLTHPPLIIVLESVEKPGNLGAVLRSADASGADALIVCDPLTDIFNPNLIRASVGAIFSVPTLCCSSTQAISFLKERGIQILTAQLQDSELYYERNMTVPTAIVMGTESTGLGKEWREAADAHIRIPMLGIEDSLNVSVSAAILLFEAVRQRQKK